MAREYHAYLQGSFDLPAGEEYQIGFRLAKLQGHAEVHAVDWNEPIASGFGALLSFVETLRPDAYRDMRKSGDLALSKLQKDIATRPLIETLRRLNSRTSLRHDHEIHMRLASVDVPAGIDWVPGWYRRNLKILANIARLVERPDDRILVIYGAGHISLLTQFLRASGIFCVVPIRQFLLAPTSRR